MISPRDNTSDPVQAAAEVDTNIDLEINATSIDFPDSSLLANAHSLPESPTPGITVQSSIAPQKSNWHSIATPAITLSTTAGNAVERASQTVTGAVSNSVGKLGDIATQTRTTIVENTKGIYTALGDRLDATATRTGATILNGAKDMGKAIGAAATQTGTTTITVANKLPAGLGNIVNYVTDHPQLRFVTKHLKIDQLLYGLIDQVDIDRAEAYVKKIQTQYPTENSYQIAHRLILKKAIYAGGTGFASSFIPGAAASLFALDLAATLALQAEMLYQIAAAYHLDLQDPARKGEILAIFGLTLGGNSSIKAGLGFARNLPTVGAVIGASSNAVLIYTLGQAACQFYGSKISPLSSIESLQNSQVASDRYLQAAIDQEVTMDQILVHVILAGQPGKTWAEILPELPQLQFSPASIAAIESSSESPPTFGELLDKLNPDFSRSLLVQCQKLVEADGIMTTAESQIIEQIRQRNTV